MQTNNCFLLLSNPGNVYSSAFLSISIDNAVVLSKIDKGEPVESQISSVDEPLVFFMESLVELDEVITVVIIENDRTIVIGCSGSKKILHELDRIVCSDVNVNT